VLKKVNRNYLGGGGFGWALTVKDIQGFYIAGCSYDAFVGLRQ